MTTELLTLQVAARPSPKGKVCLDCGCSVHLCLCTSLLAGPNVAVDEIIAIAASVDDEEDFFADPLLPSISSKPITPITPIEPPQPFFSKIAVPLIERGIPVIPLRPRTKIAFLDGWQELASTDPLQIAEWAKQYPDSNCAAVALAQPGGIWFWEYDKPEVLRQYTAVSGLEPPRTFSVRSRPGRGHFYFLQNAASIALGNIAQNFVEGEGFSVRCDREYVVAASSLQGSLHPITGLPYEVTLDVPIIEAPDALVKWLIAQKTSSQTSIQQAAPGQPITAGKRNGALTSIAGTMRNRGLDGDTIEMALQDHNRKYCSPPMDTSEVHTIAWSVARYEPTPDKPVMLDGHDITQPIVATAATAATTLKAIASAFALPQVPGTIWDYIVAPAVGQIDGWFPRGEISIIGGPSGSNKSTLMMDLLDCQLHGVDFLGHKTFKHPYLILTADRGNAALERTLTRMGLQNRNIPIDRLRAAVGVDVLREIQTRLENTKTMPAAVFLEGADLILEDASKMNIVKSFLTGLQEIARWYHVALILSVGAPKVKTGEGYVAKRDMIFGSIAWGRMSETIMVLQYPGGEDTSEKRELAVLLRNGAAEAFQLMLQQGKLVVDNNAETAQKEAAEITWFKAQALQGWVIPDKKWFTVRDLEIGLNISRSTAAKRIKDASAHSYLVKKPGKKTGQGAADMYRWNDAADNPLWDKAGNGSGGATGTATEFALEVV